MSIKADLEKMAAGEALLTPVLKAIVTPITKRIVRTGVKEALYTVAEEKGIMQNTDNADTSNHVEYVPSPVQERPYGPTVIRAIPIQKEGV